MQTDDGSLCDGGHHIWTPGMELRVAQDIVDYVDNDQTQSTRSAEPGIGAPELGTEHAEQGSLPGLGLSIISHRNYLSVQTSSS